MGYTFTTYNKPSSDVLSGLESLVNNYNTAYGEARAANESRYQQMLGIANQTTNQRAADITSDYAKQSASAMQNLARLGMANTTIGTTTNAGITRNKQSALNNLADTMQQTKLGILDKMKTAEPDATSLQSIIAGIGGSYGGGQGLSAMLQALSGINY